SLVEQSSGDGVTGYDTGEHHCATPVTIAPMSGRPTAAPAWSLQFTSSSTLVRKSIAELTIAKSCAHAVITALRDWFGLSLVSMKSATILRPPIPPPPAFELRYAAAPVAPSTTPWNSPGWNGLSTSAGTATWISLAVMPTSVAVGLA